MRHNIDLAGREKQKRIKEVVGNFSPYNIYLWLHFVGFTTKVHFSRSSFRLILISVILCVLNEGLTAIIILSKLLQLNEVMQNRQNTIELVSEIGELYVRILVIMKRRHLLSIAEKVAEIYVDGTKKNLIKFKKTIIIVLFISEGYYYVRGILKFLDADFHMNYLEDGFYFDFIKSRYASTLNYVCTELHYKNMLSPFVLYYFSGICYILKHILINFKEKLIITWNVNLSSLSIEYNRIMRIISLINKIMHNMLATSIFILIVWVFYASYIVLFTNPDSLPKRISIIMLLVVAFIQFSSACIFGSSVIEAVNDVNDAILDLPLRVTQCESLNLFLKANRKFDGFTLFGRIVIDKILILSTLGSLLTYGILIATFNV